MWIGLFFLAGLLVLFGYGAWMRHGTSGLSASGLDPAQTTKLGFRGGGTGAVPRLQAGQLDCRSEPA
jgi:ABC-type transporter Mla subunit MlaD